MVNFFKLAEIPIRIPVQGDPLHRIIDFYEFMKGSIHTSQVRVDDCLLINYRCWETGKDVVWFKEPHFVFILSGDKKWEFGSEVLSASEGDIVFIKQGSGIIHHSNNVEFCALILFLPQKQISKFLIHNNIHLKTNEHSLATKLFQKLDSNVVLEGFRNSLLSYLTDSGIAFESIAKTKLEELLHYIFTQRSYEVIADYLKTMVQRETDHLQFIMENNYMRPLSLENFADMCNMSLSSFKRKFKESYKIPPGNWLSERRLSLAKKLLTSSELTVAEIVQACGYNSTSYFVKAFKKESDSTPLQYRNQAWSKK